MTVSVVTQVLGDIVSVLTGALTSMATGIGSGANAFATALVYDSSGTTPVASAFILTVALVGGIALAVAFGRRMFGFIISLGGRR